MRAYKIAKSLVGRHALIIVFVFSLALTFSNRVEAQQASEPELAVKVSYDRFQNVTFYETSRMELEAQDKQQYGGTPLTLTAAFACRGNTGQQPCMPPLISLRFSYVAWGEGSLGKSVEEFEHAFNNMPLPKPPFDYTYRNAFAVAGSISIPLGAMAVNHRYDSEMKGTFWDGGLNLDLYTMRKLAAAKELELRVGAMAVILTYPQKVLLAGFYNTAIGTYGTAQKTSTKPRNTRRRKP